MGQPTLQSLPPITHVPIIQPMQMPTQSMGQPMQMPMQSMGQPMQMPMP
jgi:hypothetical protein